MALAAVARCRAPMRQQRSRRAAVEDIEASMQRRGIGIELHRAQRLDRCRQGRIAQALAPMCHQWADPSPTHRWRYHRRRKRQQGRGRPGPRQPDRILAHLEGLNRQRAAQGQHIGHRVTGGNAKRQHHSADAQQRGKALDIAQGDRCRVHRQAVTATGPPGYSGRGQQVFQLDAAGGPVSERQFEFEIDGRQAKLARALAVEIGVPAQFDRQRATQCRSLVDLRATRADRVADDRAHSALLGHTVALQFTHAL